MCIRDRGKIIALVILIILAVIAAAGGLWWKTQVKPPEIPIAEEDKEALPEGVQKNDGVYSVLVIGTDKVGLNTDTIFVASFDTINDKIKMCIRDRLLHDQAILVVDDDLQIGEQTKKIFGDSGAYTLWVE